MAPVKKKKRVFYNPMLLPVFFVLAILPFLTKFILYDTGLDEFSWYSQNGMTGDFYVYYKSRAFLLMSVITLLLLIGWFFLYREKWTSVKPFLPFLPYCILVLISTFCSVSPIYSQVGIQDQFESVFVLLGYVVIAIYTFQVFQTEQIKSILAVGVGASFFMGIIGVLQLLNYGLSENSFFQKLVMSPSDFDSYAESITSNVKTNALSFTLNNPNYAGVYLVIFLVFFGTFLVYCSELRRKPLFFCFCIIEAIFFFFLLRTYSRAGIFSFFCCAVLLIIFLIKQKRIRFKPFLFLIFGVFIVFIVFDSTNCFSFTKRILKTFITIQESGQENRLTSIVTGEKGVEITYNNQKILLSFEENSILNQTQIKVTQVGKNRFIACIDEFDWEFLKQNNVYYYLNPYGKLERLEKISSFFFENYEKIASGRGYIWSRTIPLLKDYLFLGSGPDTFRLVFPQHDRVGKFYNCKHVKTVIERAHNFFLMTSVQTGIASFLCLLIFYLKYFKECIGLYFKVKQDTLLYGFGFACFLASFSYVIAAVFVDSSVGTTPIVCVLLGMGIKTNTIIKQNKILI